MIILSICQTLYMFLTAIILSILIQFKRILVFMNVLSDKKMFINILLFQDTHIFILLKSYLFGVYFTKQIALEFRTI